MLVTQELTVKVDNKIIFDNVNLDFGPGIHIVMGPNGVGKSTFGHALMGNPNYNVEGAVELNGKDLLAMETHERANAGLFLGFQTPTPIEGLSNFQFVKQFMSSKKELDVMALGPILSQYKQLADDFKLPQEFDKSQLNVEASGGEKKKSEIIQMMIADPDVVVLDEPDSGLDIDAINELAVKLKEFMQRDPNKVLIIITHYEKLIEKISPDTVTVLRRDGAKTYEDLDVAYDILENGFGEYV